MTLGRRVANGRRLVQALFQTPIISVNQAANQLGVSHQTANLLIGEFERLELLREITGHQRNRLYLFELYLGIFKEKN